MRIPCPSCNGDGFISYEDRHTETRTESCKICSGYGEIEAGTGYKREASFNPETGKAFAEDKPDAP